MKRLSCAAAAAAVAIAVLFIQGGLESHEAAAYPDEKGEAATPMIGHMVFFTLNESTPENRAKLVAACDKYLSDHDGTVHYSAGIIAEDMNREVNVRDFDVALHLVFKDGASHDAYQSHARHVQFIEENKTNWKAVRVFDSLIGGK